MEGLNWPSILEGRLIGTFIGILSGPEILYAVYLSFIIANLLMVPFGYLLEANGFPVAPVVLGIVLGPIVEKNFMMSMIKTDWDMTQFFTRPVSALLCTLTLLIWFFPLIGALWRNIRRTVQAKR